MGLFGKALADWRENEIKDSRRRLERLESKGLGNTDAARSARSDIRWHQKQLVAEEYGEEK